MKTINAKILALGVFLLAGMISQAGAQQVYQQSQPTTAYQQYRPQQSNRPAPRPSYGLSPRLQQNHRSLREQLNPCNTNYGIVMDGWHDAMLLSTVKSAEWWLAVILSIALLAVGYDDLYRKQRATDMLEATAGMGQILLNDRAYCLRKANDSIAERNKLILHGDTLAQDAEARSQAESHLAIRSMVIQAEESSPVLETEIHPTGAVVGNHLVLDGDSSEPGYVTQGDQEVAEAGSDDAEPSASGDTEAAENLKYSTLKHGGKQYKIPTVIRLLVQANQSKIENQRITINQLQERLRQYEKD